MDAWWPRFVRAEFQPALGPSLFDKVESDVLSLGEFGWDWSSQVQKDLRSALGLRERGRYSRIYCGGPAREPVRGHRLLIARRHCRSVLLATLRAAVADVKKRFGSSNPANWKVHATCQHSSDCDEIVPNTAGAVDTPPFPWQNRGTFHQVDEITRHR